MTEEYLYRIWSKRLFRQEGHLTVLGEAIEVISPGERNWHSGPDFFNARIRIGDTVWAGNVEIHVCASDWYLHAHKGDKAYDQVVLHVVYEADAEIFRSDGKVVPMLVLKDAIPNEYSFDKAYQDINHNAIPCAALLSHVPDLPWESTKDQMIKQRLNRRAVELSEMLRFHGGDVESCFFEWIARSLGAQVNAEPFGQLSRAMPLRQVLRYAGDLCALESLFFGLAGFLEQRFNDLYPQDLQKDFRFFQLKYGLQPLPVERWRFMRLRPVNFPTLRIAQLVNMIHSQGALYASMTACLSVESIIPLLDVQASAYWNNHFVFDKVSPQSRIKRLGASAMHNLIINAVAPFLYFQGTLLHRSELCQRALSFLKELPPEHNTVMVKWKQTSLRALNAYDSQALLELYGRACKFKKCLTCSIGKHLLV